MSRRRKLAAATLGAAIATAPLGVGAVSIGGLGAGPANAAGALPDKPAAVGSGLGTIDTTAIGYSVRVPFYSHNGEDVEAESPYSLAAIGLGNAGHAVTSVLWPGDTGAHGGDVLDLVGIGDKLPAGVGKMLNDPEKAEAQSAVGPSTVSKSGPGFSMTATATSTHVAADSHGGGDAVPAVGKFFGKTSSSSGVDIVGPKTVVLTAASSVHDISVGGVLKISSVTTTARATTAATTSTGTANTVVQGVTVAGIPVTVDDKGVHVGKPVKKLPLLSPDAVVNKALKQSGISLKTTKPVVKTKGSTVSVVAGTLTVYLGNSQYKSQGNDTATTLVLGGAKIDGTSTKSFPPVKIKPVKPPKSVGGSHSSGTAGTPGTPGTPGSPGTSTGGSASSPQVAAAPSSGGGGSSVLAAANVPLLGGIKAWWAVLSLLAAGLLAGGLRRLPDRVLEGAAATCRLEEL